MIQHVVSHISTWILLLSSWEVYETKTNILQKLRWTTDVYTVWSGWITTRNHGKSKITWQCLTSRRLDDFSQKIWTIRTSQKTWMVQFLQKIWRRRLYSQVIWCWWFRWHWGYCCPAWSNELQRKDLYAEHLRSNSKYLREYSFKKINLHSQYVLCVSMFYRNKRTWRKTLPYEKKYSLANGT